MKTSLLSMRLGLALIVATASFGAFSSSARADEGLGPIADRCRATSHKVIGEAEEFYDDLYGGHERDLKLQAVTEEFLQSLREFNKHVKRFATVAELREKFEELRSKFRAVKSTFDESELSRSRKLQKRFGDFVRPWEELAEIVDHA